MKTQISALIYISVLASTANANEAVFRKLYGCGDQNGSLVVDVNTDRPDEIQVVVEGDHAIQTLMFNYGREESTESKLARSGGRIIEERGNRKMIFSKLNADVRASEFIHVHEGLGFYHYQPVLNPRSVLEMDRLNFTSDIRENPITVYFTLGLFSPSPRRTAFVREGTVRLELGFNNYIFYNCSEPKK
jgi:hypothetical protein